VIRRIEYGQTPDAELDILHADMQEQEGITLPEVTDEHREKFRPIYSDYQNERKAVFLELANTVPYGKEIAQQRYPQALAGALVKCITRLAAAVGEQGFNDMFGVSPQTLAGRLGGFK
jgi:hypothetical protein